MHKAEVVRLIGAGPETRVLTEKRDSSNLFLCLRAFLQIWVIRG